MMRITVPAVGWLCLTLIGCAAGSGPAAKPVVDELHRLNQAYESALIEADAAALDRLYAPEFVYVVFDGSVRTKSEQIQTLTSGRVDVLSGESDQVSVRLYGDVAVMTGRFRGRAKIGDKEFSVAERYSTVWVRTGSAWQLVLEHATELKE